jgi:hypothetical protein
MNAYTRLARNLLYKQALAGFLMASIADVRGRLACALAHVYYLFRVENKTNKSYLTLRSISFQQLLGGDVYV